MVNLRRSTRCVSLLAALLWLATPAPAGAAGAEPPWLLWAGAEEAPPALSAALAKTGARLLPGGPLWAARRALAQARGLIAGLRCGDAVTPLEQAEATLLSDVAVDDARATLGQVEALLLSCADRLGQEERARRAAARLLMTGVEVPPDVALALRRYREGQAFGPPPPPARVESDPPGAQVLRNLLRLGAAPQQVPGGDAAVDLLDVELPGFRKVHRPLGPAKELLVGLRAEDRLPVLVDAASSRPFGSEEQGAALRLLARTPPAPALVAVLGPAQQGGQAVAGERLRARIFDVAAGRFRAPAQDIAAGGAAEQAAALQALLASKDGKAIAARPAAAPAVVPAPAPAKVEPKKSFLGILAQPFAKTKWYTWAIAGGVTALVVGLMVAGRYGKDSVTLDATYTPPAQN